MRTGTLLFLTTGLLLAVSGASSAEETAKAPSGKTRRIVFETDILPLLNKKCARCHNDATQKGELDLGTAQSLFMGGETGAAITPGKRDDSLLWHYVHDRYMPPEGEGELTDAEITLIGDWIDGGARLKSGSPEELLAGAEVSNHDIEPLMLLRCAVCHGLRRQEAGLDLRTKASMLKGGKSGRAIVLGKPEESLVLKRIHAGEMPPNDQLIKAGVFAMTEDEVQKLARWIELGAPEIVIEPDVATTAPDRLVTDQDRQFWAFQPPQAVTPPNVTALGPAAGRVRNPIDAFILEKLTAAGLSFSPEADRLTLIRRATFDLTGLPPEPDEVAAFLADTAPHAYERLIDRLLESPRYGEKWGRMWLDLAGYADSEGKRSADPVRPFAWKYRDYVIRAFNDDKPYDRFLLEQLAGDELADYAHAEMTPERLDNLIATGFLRMAPDGTGSDVVNRVPERLEVISDEIDVFGSVVMGLTLKCARCHSHKYDPIPQRDYFRLVDIFKGAFDEHDWLKPASVPGQTDGLTRGRYLSYCTPEERAAQDEFNRDLDRRIGEENAKLDALAAKLRNEHLESQLKEVPEVLRDDVRTAFATPADQRTEVQKYLADKFKPLWLDDSQLKKKTEYQAESRNVSLSVRALQGQKQPEPQIRALWDRGNPSPTYIYRRGDYLQPARLVGPGVPSVLTDGKTPFVVEPVPGSTGRRLALARWLTQPGHPLTARVMVNRLWQGHFGQGIVRSTGNFGKLGTPPSHPELLDWLAREFDGSGSTNERPWSIKRMHRLMMTSTTYRQASTLNETLERLDPENVLLSRMPMWRLTAEEVNDSLFFVAGRLDLQQFGRPDPVNVRGDGLVTPVGTDAGWRRSIYVQHRRFQIPTVLETFDQPQMNPNCLERPSSTVAQQALYLMNNGLVHELAGHFADRLRAETSEPARQIERLYSLALGRPPLPEESTVSLEILEQLRQEWTAKSPGDPAKTNPDRAALAALCHTVMNSAAFLYVD